ncbi:MAG: SH3 domain-containing protein [Vicinamibacteria bacterium]|nr:SH3 domain-containing protein [Vicinamibacteria bacterium]
MTRSLVFLLSASLTIGPTSWAGASDEPNQLRVTGTKVNVRSEPSTTARVVYQVNEGDILQSLGQSGKWHKISDSKGRQGYIYSALVTPVLVTKTAKTSRLSEARASKPAAGVDSSRRGPSKKTLLIGGGVAAAGIGALLLLSGGDDSKKDKDEDGFTPDQGDCDDNNAEVNPNGAVTATATSNIAGQAVDCTANSTWRVEVVNNSCEEVSVTGLTVIQTVLEGPCEASVEQHSATQSVVPAASAVVVHDESKVTGCCVAPGCSSSASCRFNRVYNVLTSAGNLRTAPIQCQINFGPQCPICP